LGTQTGADEGEKISGGHNFSDWVPKNNNHEIKKGDISSSVDVLKGEGKLFAFVRHCVIISPSLLGLIFCRYNSSH
jgi:hypothetical protein